MCGTLIWLSCCRIWDPRASFTKEVQLFRGKGTFLWNNKYMVIIYCEHSLSASSQDEHMMMIIIMNTHWFPHHEMSVRLLLLWTLIECLITRWAYDYYYYEHSLSASSQDECMIIIIINTHWVPHHKMSVWLLLLWALTERLITRWDLSASQWQLWCYSLLLSRPTAQWSYVTQNGWLHTCQPIQFSTIKYSLFFFLLFFLFFFSLFWGDMAILENGSRKT